MHELDLSVLSGHPWVHQHAVDVLERWPINTGHMQVRTQAIISMHGAYQVYYYTCMYYQDTLLVLYIEPGDLLRVIMCQ